jgi:hypothetical protein
MRLLHRDKSAIEEIAKAEAYTIDREIKAIGRSYAQLAQDISLLYREAEVVDELRI